MREREGKIDAQAAHMRKSHQKMTSGTHLSELPACDFRPKNIPTASSFDMTIEYGNGPQNIPDVMTRTDFGPKIAAPYNLGGASLASSLVS